MIIIQQPEQLSQLEATQLPLSYSQFLTDRLYQLEATGNLLRTGDQLWLAEMTDDFITDYLVLGKQGIYSDTLDSNGLGDPDFASPLEFIGHHADIRACELLCQINDENCISIFIPHDVLQLHADLQNLILFLQHAEFEARGDASC